jgi:hypothetical protein
MPFQAEAKQVYRQGNTDTPPGGQFWRVPWTLDRTAVTAQRDLPNDILGEGFFSKSVYALATAASRKNSRTSKAGFGSRRNTFHIMMLIDSILRAGEARE